jgi:hypothetical protein
MLACLVQKKITKVANTAENLIQRKCAHVTGRGGGEELQKLLHFMFWSRDFFTSFG